MERRLLVLLGALVITVAAAAGLSVTGAPTTADAPDDGGARYRLDPAQAERAGVAFLDPSLRVAGPRFAPGTGVSDRHAFEAAVTAARPEARQLVDLVDGLVTVSFTDTGTEALGVTATRPDGYDVVVDLTRTRAGYGPRGVSRVILHELAHVVDFAIVPEEVDEQLDRGIPTGHACAAAGADEACAQREERFAETFAKWATGDIGASLYVGYAVPPPAMTLEVWAAPLVALSRP